MACVAVALRALRIFSSACVFSCVRCVFRCVKFLSLRILLRALRIRCVFFLSLRIPLRWLRIRCVKFRSLRILLRALRILLRISLRNGLALRALRCVRRMEIGLYLRQKLLWDSKRGQSQAGIFGANRTMCVMVV